MFVSVVLPRKDYPLSLNAKAKDGGRTICWNVSAPKAAGKVKQGWFLKQQLDIKQTPMACFAYAHRTIYINCSKHIRRTHAGVGSQTPRS